jgi:hypothetical protein
MAGFVNNKGFIFVILILSRCVFAHETNVKNSFFLNHNRLFPYKLLFWLEDVEHSSAGRLSFC